MREGIQRACEVLGIKKVEVTYPGGLKKIGLGRVIDGAKAIERLEHPEGKGGVVRARPWTKQPRPRACIGV